MIYSLFVLIFTLGLIDINVPGEHTKKITFIYPDNQNPGKMKESVIYIASETEEDDEIYVDGLDDIYEWE